MKQSLIFTQHSPYLILFFAGWGMDETPFAHYRPQDADLMVCYDYRCLDFNPEALSGYTEIHLVAWSMGVWAASQVMRQHTFAITRSTAVNGTLHPVDAERGIAPAIFQGTLDGLSEASLAKFQRRMCKDAETYRHFQTIAPRRGWEDLRDELAAIGRQYGELPPSGFGWDVAFIGNNDRIFAPQAQQKAWEGVGTSTIPGNGAHYDPDLLQHLCQYRTNDYAPHHE